MRVHKALFLLVQFGNSEGCCSAFHVIYTKFDQIPDHPNAVVQGHLTPIPIPNPTPYADILKKNIQNSYLSPFQLDHLYGPMDGLTDSQSLL